MYICGIKVHIVSEKPCVETQALKTFGLLTPDEQHVSTKEKWKHYGKQLKLLGYNGDIFLNSDLKYIHLQAFFPFDSYYDNN